MTRNTTSFREKGQAVFLAALMVLSVVAMSAAFAGSVAADDDPVTISDGDNFYEGEVVEFDQINEEALSDDGVVDVSEVDGDRGTELSIDEGVATLNTASQFLGPGTYEVSHDGETAEIDIRGQTIVATALDESVAPDGDADVSIESDRSGYDAEITSEDFDADDLAGMIEGADLGEDADGNDVAVVADLGNDETVNVDFDEVAAGEYNFTVSAADTVAEDDFSIEVLDEDDAHVSFSGTGVAEGILGDQNTVTLELDNTDRAILSIDWTPEGEDDPITVLKGELTGADDDEDVEIDIDTTKLGTGDDDDIATTENGNFEVTEGADWDAATQLEVYNEWTNSFDMNLYHEDEDDRHDRGVFRFSNGAIEDVTTYVVNDDDVDTLDEYGAEADGTVAAGDYVAVEIKGNGFFAVDNPFNLTVVQNNAGFNAEPESLDVDEFDEWSEDDERAVIFFETGEETGAEEGFGFDVDLNMVADASEEAFDEANPYAAEAQSFEDMFTVEERTLAFDEELFEVAADEGQEITGTSNAAPGAIIELEAEAGEPHPFYIPADTEVEADGTWTAAMDFSGQIEDVEFDLSAAEVDGPSAQAEGLIGEVGDDPFLGISANAPAEVETGDDATLDVTITNTGAGTAEGTVTVTVAGEEVVSEDVELESGDSTDFSHDFDTAAEGDIEWEVETDDDSDSGVLTVADEEEQPPSDDGQDDEGDDHAPEDDDDDDDDDDDGTPGFGVAVALVALLSAAMLALRRMD
ncbi:BGTF surface domain-containing protein [Halovivax gelatinilyticus]|uniref:BGTF surface domain-containing protein n=1 Tax=Halovivax gelatinilyticus TaxID=2961597 RepID=UPI002113DB59|nr:BGTF surface domain-containing protein [Halovivax gelatinilyticus]